MDTPRRSKTAVPPATQQRSRQDPVSCESCRKKKLKCSRQHPCSNCTSRGIRCEFNRLPTADLIKPAPPAEQEDVSSLRDENAAVKARLERLEAIIYGKCSADTTGGDERPTKARRLDNGQTAMNGSKQVPTPPASAAPSTEAAKNYVGDFTWLECVGAQENGRLSKLSLPLPSRIEPLDGIIQIAIAETGADRLILLPPHEETFSLVDAYMEHLDPTQHFIHCPTVKRSMRTLYDQLERGETVEPNQMVLVLSMLASMSSYWGLGQCSNPFFQHRHMAVKVGQLWLRTTLDILEHVRRSASANLETLQASLIALSLIFHIEGSSPKVRAMKHAALSVAKDLRLHRIDDPSLPAMHMCEIEKETNRRIWWFLVTIDWSMSIAGGPHEGCYNVNPNHMRVKNPRNVTDEELESMPDDFDRPLEHPSIMAFYLLRIRLGHICREITDLRWSAEADEVAVEDVQALDAKFNDLFKDIPLFLRLDRASKLCYAHLDQPGSYIRLQRYTINLAVHAKRCKFHLPFLLRASFDPAYKFCREACLRSARTVIQIREELMLEEGSLWFANASLCGILHLLFYATVVLVMDLCVNRGEECESARTEEIRHACRRLDEAKRQSSAAGIFLDSLLTILRKHRIKIEGKECLNANNATIEAAAPSSTNTESYPIESRQICPNQTYVADASATETVGSLDLGDIWQSYIGMESTWNQQCWDALISDIERIPQEDDLMGMHIPGF